MKYQVEPLINAFRENANPVRAAQSKKYLKDKFECIGLDSKTRRSLQKEFFKKYGYPDLSELFTIVSLLWKLPEREFQYVAIELLQRNQKKLARKDITSIEKYIIQKSWWDSVDGLAAWICGAYFDLYPEQREPVINKWMQSGNIWLQRTCLIFQLKYKDKTDSSLLEKLIGELAEEKEFFIRKAIGWILREYSKTNPSWVSAFVDRQPLSGLSYREATKYL